MKLILTILLFISSLSSGNGYCQTISLSFNKGEFFEDTSIFNATITTDMVKFFRKKEKPGVEFNANFSTSLTDGKIIDGPINLTARGHYRRAKCFLPPLTIDFKDKKTSVFEPLGSLKLVSQCYTTETGERYLLSEYLVYKIYNLLTDMSFRVRLLNLKFVDSTGKKKPISEYAFLVENIKNVAKRNKCIYSKAKIDPRNTDDYQMTVAAIFEYMIGNTDWGVSVNHNIRLLLPQDDTITKPYVVPYDFDFSGFVNTNYAIPDAQLNITNVKTRLYRGFPVPLEVVNRVIELFKKQKDNIYSLINHFDLLSTKSKNEMTKYLDEFFELINNPEKVKYTFIENARTE